MYLTIDEYFSVAIIYEPSAEQLRVLANDDRLVLRVSEGLVESWIGDEWRVEDRYQSARPAMIRP